MLFDVKMFVNIEKQTQYESFVRMKRTVFLLLLLFLNQIPFHVGCNDTNTSKTPWGIIYLANY